MSLRKLTRTSTVRRLSVPLERVEEHGSQAFDFTVLTNHVLRQLGCIEFTINKSGKLVNKLLGLVNPSAEDVKALVYLLGAVLKHPEALALVQGRALALKASLEERREQRFERGLSVLGDGTSKENFKLNEAYCVANDS
jgi:hypothetical protein